MDQTGQDLREMRQMAVLLRGAAARAVFQDCASTFLTVAAMLEQRTMAAPPVAPPARQPVNITA